MNTPDKQKKPLPQGQYVVASRFENIIYTAGMTPRKNGILIQKGKVNKDKPLSHYKGAVRQAAANATTAALNTLTKQERLKQVLSFTIYVNTDETFETHSLLADFASEYFFEQIGNAGIGSRIAVGVSSLPGNAPIEIQLIAAISS